jgi:hypothetical protein
LIAHVAVTILYIPIDLIWLKEGFKITVGYIGVYRRGVESRPRADASYMLFYIIE